MINETLKQQAMQEEMKSLDSYTSFAYVYDTFMDQEPYDHWADRVCAFLDEFGLPRTADTTAAGKGKPCAETAGNQNSSHANRSRTNNDQSKDWRNSEWYRNFWTLYAMIPGHRN